MGSINGYDLSLFGGRDEKRAAAKREFAAELYLAASFFKQTRVTAGDKFTPLKELDAWINEESGVKQPMAHPKVQRRYIAEREPMPKIKPAPFVQPAVSTCNFDYVEEKVSPKFVFSILETIEIEGRFYIHIQGRRWWKFSYENRERAHRCETIIQAKWSDLKKMEEDLQDNFKLSRSEVQEASL